MSTPTIRCYTLSQTPLLPSPLVLLLFLFLSSLSLTSCAYLRVHSSVELWTSRLEAQPSLLLKPAHRLAHTPNSLSLDPSTRYQRILGFGGAFTEAAAVTFNRLSPTLQADVIRAYFDADKGLGYTLGRVPINSCDFSVASYSFDDVQDDFDLERFDHAVKHDNDTLIPLILKALKASTPLSPPSSSSSSSSPSSSSSSHPSPALKLFASPWSPPAWMKGNGAMLSSSSPCLKPDRRYHDAWALYYVKWLQAYAAHHIPFFGLTVQNEPEFAAPWEACTWTAEEEVAFVVDHLAPTLKRHGLEDVRIMVYDHNKDHVEKWAKVVYGEKRAADAVWGLAVHWYSGDAFDLLEAAHELSPSHALLASEACNCPGVKLNDWSRAEKYAHDIIGDLNHHVVGWTDWNLVLDERGGPNHVRPQHLAGPLSPPPLLHPLAVLSAITISPSSPPPPRVCRTVSCSVLV